MCSPSLPPEFKQMTETPADEEHDSSGKESDDYSVCD